MAKRVFLLVVLALVLPATALAATVKVRVEGKTRTLFAPTQVTVTATNALDALEQASTRCFANGPRLDAGFKGGAFPPCRPAKWRP